MLGIEAIWAQRNPLLRSAAGEVVLGQIRPVDRRDILIAQHDDGSLEPLAPQFVGGRIAGRATPDDHDSFRLFARGLAARRCRRLCALLTYEDLTVALLDRPACDGIKSRSARGLAGSKVETGMMPGTAHGVVDHEPVNKRRVIVRAQGPDREYLCSAAHQQNLLAAGVADHLAAVGKLGERYPLRQIGASQRRLFLGHQFLPWRFEIVSAYMVVSRWSSVGRNTY